MSARVIVISGPGGVGKNTVANELITAFPREFAAVTKLTTRAIRRGEQDGSEFHFITIDEFKKRLNQGELLEFNIFNGHYYGVPRRPVDDILAEGINPVLVIDVNGARATREHYKDKAFLIFLTAPLADLRQRYIDRGQRPEEADKRIEIALRDELPQQEWYDVVLENRNGEIAKVVATIADRVHSL